MADTARRVTAEDLETFAADDCRYELADGQLISMSPVGEAHGEIVVQIVALLLSHVRRRHLGRVMTEVGFKLIKSGRGRP